MRSHLSTLIPRMIRAGLRLHGCRYRVVAAGISHDGSVISIATNQPYLPNQGRHAEERVIHSTPKYVLARILLLRVNKRGERLPIHACERCERLARKRGVKIERL